MKKKYSVLTAVLTALSIFIAVSSFGSIPSFGAAPTLENESLTVVFNEKNGWIESMNHAGKSLIAEPQNSQGFDICENNKWSFGKHSCALLSLKKKSGNIVVAEYRFGDWTVALQYQLDRTLPQLRRIAKVTWNGTKPTKLKGFWWDWPVLTAEPSSWYFGPNTYPPNHYILADLPQGKSNTFGQATPSLIYERNPSLSFLFINDDRWQFGDYCSCAAEKRKAGLRVTQGFNAQGIMEPGNSQTIGAGYCLVLDCNGENALYKIHDWMKMTGNVIPQGRPKWFESAALYSFHPGGTIGSGCLDLGGFKASLPLLDRVKATGMNSVWIMPIEDQGIYHPRDYYKFQNGLGTSDDYKTLVQYAHQLGLHVLQDNVPHGGSNTNDRAKAHPEWLVYDEDGSTFSYWCFDFNWPTWREYIGKVVAHYVREYNIDGYRVDACAGSKIANWNPDIPYDRASFALRQGGLNMLRTIRSSAKAAKKDPHQVGILAETGGSVYGSVADAIYDFRGCYNLHHGMRTMKPADWVRKIRRTLHEEQYSEVKGMLRLRHSESHDSLRSQLWFGTEPMRALVALTAYIHGVPLIYQEQEIGNINIFRKIFAVRQILPELQAGNVDYLNPKVPDGVFACRRFKDGNESVVLINFNFEPVTFDLDLGKTIEATDMFAEKPVTISSGKTSVSLRPYKYTILALRKIDFAKSNNKENITHNIADNKIGAVNNSNDSHKDQATKNNAALINSYIKYFPDGDKSVEKNGVKKSETITLSGKRYRALISSKTGLLQSLEIDGQKLLKTAKIFLPESLVTSGKKSGYQAEMMTQNEKQSSFRLKFGKAELNLNYIAEEDGLVFEGKWTGTDLPVDAMMIFPIKDGQKWSAMTAEGYLEDCHRLRDANASSKSGNIYWRPQGSEVLFDSLLHPFEMISGTPQFLGMSNLLGKEAVFELLSNPLRFQWHSDLTGDKDLSAGFSFFDSDSVKTKSPVPIRFKLKPAKMSDWREKADQTFGLKQNAQPFSLIPVAGGWLFENKYYALRLKRNGAVASLVQKDPKTGAKTEIATGGCIYTDYGFAFGKDKKMRFSNENDVEAAIRIDQCNSESQSKVLNSGQKKSFQNIRLCFEGRLRGFGRFDNLRPAITFTSEFILGEGPDFEKMTSVRHSGQTEIKSAFLSNYLVLPITDRYVFLQKDKILAEGKNQQDKDRGHQTATEKLQPDQMQFFAGDRKILSIDLVAAGDLANIFMQKNNFFMAFCDNSGIKGGETKSMRVRVVVGSETPKIPLPVRSTLNVTKKTTLISSLVQDSGFESESYRNLVSLNSSETYKVIPDNNRDSAWSLPEGVRIISFSNADENNADNNAGINTNDKVSNNAENNARNATGKYAVVLTSDNGSYYLIRQNLSTPLFKSGQKYRIQCRAKGDKIVQGDLGWKVGTVRLCIFVNGKQNYISSESLLGTFDWKPVSFEFTAPADLQSISLEAGLNGANGTILFDSFSIEPVK